MDRIEIPMEGEAARWVEAAERGDEVVFVQNEQVRASLTLERRATSVSDAATSIRLARW